MTTSPTPTLTRGGWLLRLLGLAALTLLAVQPLMRGALPQTADGTLHLYRLVTLDHALADGTLWPRYVPGMVYGYGAPMFNYYAPLSLYPMQGLHLLRLDFLAAWLVGMALYMFVAISGAYRLGRAWGGEVGGWLTAAAYGYAPYLLYDLLWRGTVAELASLALLPWVLWTLTRLSRSGSRRDAALIALSLALFMPMHNVITLHSAVLIGLYALLLALTAPDARLARLLRMGGALAVGAGAVAFFWLPAVTETGLVKLEAITEVLPEIDVVGNLAPLADRFALPVTADPTQMQAPVSVALGWPQLVLALLGLPLILRDKRLRALALAAVGLIALLLFMTTSASAFVWEAVPLIRYSQFPTRLLGPASLLLALLAGMSGAALLGRLPRGRALTFGLMLAAPLIYAVPWLYTIYLPDVHPQTIVDAQDFERESGFVGTSSFGEYLPVWNFDTPDQDRLRARYAVAEVISRLDPPDGVQIESPSWQHTTGTLTLTAASDVALTFDWFYLPGWNATLDGTPLDVYPSDGVGLVSVSVPAGTHALNVWLAPTPTQALAQVLSVATLLIGGGLLLVPRLWPDSSLMPDSAAAEPVSTRARLLIVVGVGVGAFVLKVAVLDVTDTPLKQERFADGTLGAVDLALDTRFDDFVLRGVDLPDLPTRSGELLTVTAYWQLYEGARVTVDHAMVLRLETPNGLLLSESVNTLPGGLATTNWLPPPYYLADRVALDVPPGTPPGTYRLTLSVYDPYVAQFVEYVNPEMIRGVYQPLPDQAVTAPTQPTDPDTLRFDVALDLSGDGWALLGIDALPETAAVGQALTLRWGWQIDGGAAMRPDLRLVWLDADAAVSAQIPVLTRDLPSGVWVDHQRVYVPAALAAGAYRIVIDTGHVQAEVGTMQVSAPDRVYAAPESLLPLDAQWQNGLTLLGYVREGDALTLYWQTESEIARELRVFLHQFTAGAVVHIDRVPADWTRPLPGWAAGEVVADTYALFEPGPLLLCIGWYDPLTSLREPLRDGSDSLELTIP